MPPAAAGGEGARSGITIHSATRGGEGTNWIWYLLGCGGLLLSTFGEDTISEKQETLITGAVQRAWAYYAMTCCARARGEKQRDNEKQGKAWFKNYSTEQRP